MVFHYRREYENSAQIMVKIALEVMGHENYYKFSSSISPAEICKECLN